MSSKNIMLNVFAVYRQTIKAVIENEWLREQCTMKTLELMRDDLVIQVDSIIHNILINTADNFPQAPASGGTPRMREAIN